MTDARLAPSASRRRPVGLIAAVVAVALTLGVAWQARADTSLPAPGWQVTVTPTSGLLDGDSIAVNVRANDNVNVNGIGIRQCRLEATYAAPIDLSPRSGNCPVGPVSSSADLVIEKGASDGLLVLSKQPTGATYNFHVGVGATVWETPTGQTTLTCDLTHPCALVLSIDVGADTVYQVVKLQFTDADPIAACGGTATGVLNASASDELADAWGTWTRAYCAANPGGAPTRTAFPGEGSAVTSYLKGDVDVSYGTAALDPATGLAVAGSPKRPSVAVPIALNAAVLAVGGGKRQFVSGQPGDKQPYPTVLMPVGDAAGMLSGGKTALTDDTLPYKNSILTLNPALDGIPFWTGANVLASSLPLSSVLFLTKYFATVTPNDWVSRRDTPPRARGVSPSLAIADPPFTDTTLLTGRPAMGKVTFSAAINDPDGPLWVFTDRATAASLKITPVALETPSGASFVAPDAASMAAAVASMTRDANGVLQPKIAAATAATGVGAAATDAYPLTYVEYAFVPAEQLVDPTTCTARTSSQTLLSNWLTYLTGDGQATLAPGLAPLNDSLKADAAAAIAKVGATPASGTCAGRVTPETAPPGAAPPSAAGPGFTATLPTANLVNPAVPLAAASGPDTAEAKKKALATAIPAFAGHTLADPLGGVVSLVGIVLLMSLAAWITAGGSMSGGGQFTPGSLGALNGRRVGSLVLLWGGVGVACLGLVLFQLGPLIEQRDQRSMLSSYRQEVKNAAFAGTGLQSASDGPAPAPDRGSPVGILEIGALKSQDVVVEGVEASQTRRGPGHVPGTAGLGQPGNAVIVARRNGYGGSFAAIGSLAKGDRIVVTTTQGQSVYAVARVCTQALSATEPGDDGSSTSPLSTTVAPEEPCVTPKAKTAGSTTATATDPAADPAATSTTVVGATTTTAPASTTTSTAKGTGATGTDTAVPAAASKAAGGASYVKTSVAPLQVRKLYGPSDDDRLTLVTSAEKAPWNSSQATIVVAKLLSKPFEPTTQGTRAAGETGFGGDSGAWSTVILVVLAFVGVIVASVALYRKLRFRIAYVLTIAPLVALTIVVGEQIARLLPAWT